LPEKKEKGIFKEDLWYKYKGLLKVWEDGQTGKSKETFWVDREGPSVIKLRCNV